MLAWCLWTQNLPDPSHLDGTQTASVRLGAGVDEFVVHYAFKFVCFGRPPLSGLVPFLSSRSWRHGEEDAAWVDRHGLIGQEGSVRSVGRVTRDVGVEAGQEAF